MPRGRRRPRGAGPAEDGARADGDGAESLRTRRRRCGGFFPISRRTGCGWRWCFFCVILTTLSSLAGSYMLRPIINSLASAEGSEEKLFSSLLQMAAIYAVGIAAQYFQSRIMIGISQGAIFRLRNDLFSRIQKLPVRFYDTNNHGDIMSRFTNDVDAVGEMLNNTVVQIISSSINVVGTFCLMVYTNVWLTLITVATVPLMMFAARAVTMRSRRFYKAQQAALGTLNGYIEGNGDRPEGGQGFLP